MFGISVSKIILIVLIIGAVIVGTRVLGRARKGAAEDAQAAPPKAADDPSVDLVECPKCGTFHPPAGAAGGGRTGCPNCG